MPFPRARIIMIVMITVMMNSRAGPESWHPVRHRWEEHHHGNPAYHIAHPGHTLARVVPQGFAVTARGKVPHRCPSTTRATVGTRRAAQWRSFPPSRQIGLSYGLPACSTGTATPPQNSRHYKRWSPTRLRCARTPANQVFHNAGLTPVRRNRPRRDLA